MASKKQDSTTSSSSSEAISSQRPVTDNVSSSLSLYNDDSDQDKNVVPHQLSEDYSDRRLRRVEQRKLRKKKLTGMSSGISSGLLYKRKLNVAPGDGSSDPVEPPSKKKRTSKGKACPKVKCTSAFYKRNIWLHNSSVHYTLKCVNVAYSQPVSDDDSDIAALSDNEIILPGRDTPYSPLVSDDDNDNTALSDNEIILPGRDTPYSPPVSDEDPDTESDDSTADLFAQLYELYPDAE